MIQKLSFLGSNAIISKTMEEGLVPFTCEEEIKKKLPHF